MKKTSQKDQIRKALNDGHAITPLTALRNYGCMRLAARIDELRKEGMDIKTAMAGEGFAVYWKTV